MLSIKGLMENAMATILNETSIRIFGRKPENHYKVADEIISKFCRKGVTDITLVLKDQCPKRQLRWSKINANDAHKILLKKERSILAAFYLSK